MRRVLLAILALTITTTAHASGDLAYSLDRTGQLMLDGQAVGVPIGTAVTNGDGEVTIAQVLRDPTGEPLYATIDALVVHHAVVLEHVTVRDAHTRRLRVELRPDRGASVSA